MPSAELSEHSLRASVEAGVPKPHELLQMGGLRAVRPRLTECLIGIAGVRRSFAQVVDCAVLNVQAEGRAAAAAMCNASLDVPRASSWADAGSRHTCDRSLQSVRAGHFARGMAAELSSSSLRSVIAAPLRFSNTGDGREATQYLSKAHACCGSASHNEMPTR